MCIKFVTSDVTLWHLHMEKQGILKYVDTTLTFIFPYSISLHLPHFASIPSINIKTCTQIINLFTLHVILNINVSTRYLTFTCILESLIFIWWYMAYPQYWINKAWMVVCDSCAVGKIVVLFIRTSAPIIAGLGCPRLWHCANGAQRGHSPSLISVFSQASEVKCRVNKDADNKGFDYLFLCLHTHT